MVLFMAIRKDMGLQNQLYIGNIHIIFVVFPYLCKVVFLKAVRPDILSHINTLQIINQSTFTYSLAY